MATLKVCTFPFSQYDCDDSRPSDMGTSCCTMFAASVCRDFLLGAFPPDDLYSKEHWRPMLRSAVHSWDARRVVDGGFAEKELCLPLAMLESRP